MSSIVNIILELLRASRGYLRDMSKAPLKKIEETLDIATLVWMLLYGSFPYPTAQQQIEEQLGNIERTIEENPEQAKQGFSWLYRIGNVYRFVHVQPVWVTDVLNYKIRTLLHKTINDYLQSSDLLNYHVATLITPSLRTETVRAYDSVGYSTEKYEIIETPEYTYEVLHKELRLSEKTIVYDMLARIIIPVIRPTFTETITLSEALEKYISSLTAKTLQESLSLTDGINILTRGKSILTYSETLTLLDELISSVKQTAWRFAETLTLSDEIAPETYTFKQLIALTFDEVLSVVDGGISGYPYPEEPTKTYMQYKLAETIRLFDLLEAITVMVAPILSRVSTSEYEYATRFNTQRKVVRTSDGTLYCVYMKQLLGKYQIYVKKSVDNGKTWTGETRISTYPGMQNYDQWHPSIAVDSQDRLHVVWNGTADGGPPQIWYNYYDGSWHTPVRISTYTGMSTNFQNYPCIAVDSEDNLHVVWQGQGLGAPEYQIWYTKYDGEWHTPVRISTYPV